MSSKNRHRQFYQKILERLPKSYPKPKLVIHKTNAGLYKSYWGLGVQFDLKKYMMVAWCSSADYTVHTSSEVLKTEEECNLLFYYLHEIGHLYAYERYGEEDKRWADHDTCEKYADNFAARWSKKLLKEGF